MIKSSVLIFAACMATTGYVSAQAIDEITLADPTIYVADDNSFYLYGTDGTDSNHGFPAYHSSDLTEWTPTLSLPLAKGDAFGTKWFWAPQVLKHIGKYYMFYTADENIAYATSSSPEGPFTGGGKIESDVRQIDPFLFFDVDGTPYLYHVRLDKGNRIFVARLTEDLSAIIPESLTECVSATMEWEDTAHADWTVTEGPTVVYKEGLYYMFYSANDFRNPDYAVGLAKSSSPTGPWLKSERPLISRDLVGEPGTGHGDFFYTADGLPHYVFHVHHDAESVAPRITAIVDLDKDTFEPLPGTFRKLQIKEK
jgi:beta-xylosidase